MSFFITFEGIEGSGKTTQMRLLQKHLLTLGLDVLITREPGGCQISDSIRSLLLDPANTVMTARTELLLYAASRSQHVAEVIEPALRNGKIVLCDRFTDATRAYQGAGRGLDKSFIDNVNEISCDNLTPDLTLLLDYPVEQGLTRARSRNVSNDLENEGRFELEEVSFHRCIRQEYLDLAARLDRFRVIDAQGSEAEVSARIKSEVELFLTARRSA